MGRNRDRPHRNIRSLPMCTLPLRLIIVHVNLTFKRMFVCELFFAFYWGGGEGEGVGEGEGEREEEGGGVKVVPNLPMFKDL